MKNKLRNIVKVQEKYSYLETSRAVMYFWKKDQKPELGHMASSYSMQMRERILRFLAEGAAFSLSEACYRLNQALAAVLTLAVEEMVGYFLKIEGNEVRYGLKRVESEESRLSQ